MYITKEKIGSFFKQCVPTAVEILTSNHQIAPEHEVADQSCVYIESVFRSENHH